MPFVLSVNVFRKHFYWPDAMNEKQHRAWQSGNILDSYAVALSDGKYTSNLKPYVYKLGALGLIIGLIETGNEVIDLTLIWCLFSIFPVLVTIVFTVPCRPLVYLANVLKK